MSKKFLSIGAVALCLFAACTTPRSEWVAKTIVGIESEDLRAMFVGSETLERTKRKGVYTVWLPRTFWVEKEPSAEIPINNITTLKDALKLAFPDGGRGGAQVRLISRNSIIQTSLFSDGWETDSFIVSPGDILIVLPRR